LLMPREIFSPGPMPTFGGAERDRTDDLRLAKPALSQLSYSPVGVAWHTGRRVGQGRVELPTSRLSGVRSNHLSYWPQEALPAMLALLYSGGCVTRWALAPWKLNRTRL
jgi:hypothetical protein